MAVNVIQHPLPTALCWKLGQAIRRAVESCPDDLKVVILGTGGMSHQLNGAPRFGHLNTDFDKDFLDKIEADPLPLTEMTHQHIMEEAGAEAVELIMWLTMRGALKKSAAYIGITMRR